MPNIPAGFAQASFVHGTPIATREAVCTLGIDMAAATPAAVVTGLSAAWRAQILNFIDNGWALRRTELRLGPLPGDGPTIVDSTTGSGLQTGSGATPQVCVLAKKITNLGGRKNRGRMYFPGVPEAEVSEAGELTGAFATAVQTRLDNFLGAVVALGVTPVILHNDATTPTEIIDLVVQNLVATQRRRLRG